MSWKVTFDLPFGISIFVSSCEFVPLPSNPNSTDLVFEFRGKVLDILLLVLSSDKSSNDLLRAPRVLTSIWKVSYVYCFAYYHQKCLCPLSAQNWTFMKAVERYKALNVADKLPIVSETFCNVNCKPNLWPICRLLTLYAVGQGSTPYSGRPRSGHMKEFKITHAVLLRILGNSMVVIQTGLSNGPPPPPPSVTFTLCLYSC